VPGLTGVTAIAAASESTCALLSGGTIECWGDNEYGELGDGTTAGPETCEFTGPCSTSPVAVLGLSNATAIAASAFDVCAILTDQTVRCWGNDDVGQIGNPGSGVGTETCSDGSPHCATSPTTVSGLTKVTALAMGGDSACALLMGGRVECWGSNETGELGNGTTTNAPAPALVSSP
jgi:alpha-tubulin suppressor-like RCC1 family protein